MEVVKRNPTKRYKESDDSLLRYYRDIDKEIESWQVAYLNALKRGDEREMKLCEKYIDRAKRHRRDVEKEMRNRSFVV